MLERSIMDFMMTALFGLLLSIPFVFFFVRQLMNSNHKEVLRNWPIVGMLPSLLLNLKEIHDWTASILARSGHTYVFKGPWFANMNRVWTCDPANIRYISTTNFSNFHKGPKFKEMFEVMGDGILSSDSELWLSQRKIGQALISHSRFLKFVKKTSWALLETGLIPLVENAVKQGQVVDLQDVFQRFTLDMICVLTTGAHTGCLSIELPKVPFAEAIRTVSHVAFQRNFVPTIVWKLKRRFGIGNEGENKKAWKVVDDFINHCISTKREQLKISKLTHVEEEPQQKSDADVCGADLLSVLMEEDEGKSDKYLRDFVFTFFAAGTETTTSGLTWFFWLLSQNPLVETKILDELMASSPVYKEVRIFDVDELSGMVNLHAALCESMRLYPPIPYNLKNSISIDVLPSGHQLNPDCKILLSSYAMGRMEAIWGEDCLEFKPERWILKNGGIKYEPPYKFPAFYSGPRTCLGKDFAFTQMKMVAATLLYNYHVEVEQGHPVSLTTSIVLHMKYGLKVKFKRRVLL